MLYDYQREELRIQAERAKHHLESNCPLIEDEAAVAAWEYILELEAENEKLRKGFEIYEREHNRYKHATPEMSGAYFLTGGHGPTDDNQMPQFVEIVPAYGCAWSMIYENTGRTISYEGS